MKVVFQSGPRAGQELEVKPGASITFGRESDVDVVLDDPRVSRPHARLRVDATGNAHIEDLNSSNGTFLNGRKIVGATPLRSGDTLSIGNTRFSVGAPVKSGQPTVVAGPSSGGGSQGATTSAITNIRQSVSAANRRAAVAIGVAVMLVAVAVVGGGWYLLAGRPLSDADVSAQMKPSVLFVLAQGAESGHGTGWVLDAEKGLIVTNNHVIAEGRSFTVSAEGITARTANVLASSPCDDVAILHVDDKAGLESVKLGSQGDLRQGDEVIAFGFPGTQSADDKTLVVTPGSISVVNTTFGENHDANLQSLPNVILSTAKVNPGNSGGPLVNRAAEVVGMNSISNQTLDQNWAIGIDRIKEIAGTLSEARGIGWTGMGLVRPTAAQLANRGFDPLEFGTVDPQSNIYTPDALLIVSAVPGSEADQNGFNDVPLVLTAIDGQPVRDFVDYCSVARDKQPGEQSELTLVALADEGTATFTFPIHYR